MCDDNEAIKNILQVNKYKKLKQESQRSPHDEFTKPCAECTVHPTGYPGRQRVSGERVLGLLVAPIELRSRLEPGTRNMTLNRMYFVV